MAVGLETSGSFFHVHGPRLGQVCTQSPGPPGQVPGPPSLRTPRHALTLTGATNLQHVTMLASWATSNNAWSDRTYTITDLGDFTTPAYDVFMQTTVSQRTSTWSFILEKDATVVVLTDAGSETAPELSGWSSCSGVVQFEVNSNTYEMSECRSKDFGAGETVAVTSPGAKNMAFVKYTEGAYAVPCSQYTEMEIADLHEW